MHSLSEFANAIRMLSVDAVQQAKSGHPGMPLGMADIAAVLWSKYLKHNPTNPHWCDRDRFVLSNGHGSMLLYSLLHLTGYDLSIDDIKDFRQLNSKTPGHPECTDTPGVETTTGPLGQGLANAVGMAIAEKMLAKRFNDEQCELVNHYTYTFVGDGCLMEGISHEACSLAGTLGLGKLIVFYDDNGISIDGEIDEWFTDDTEARFKAYNWQVIANVDGHDQAAIAKAIEKAQQEQDKPTIIMCKTVIGFGSILAGTAKSHGAPLGDENIQKLRDTLNWPHPAFTIPEELYEDFDSRKRGIDYEQEWINKACAYQERRPDDYYEFLRRVNGDLPDLWHENSDKFIERTASLANPIATRKASQECIEFFASILPELVGGSADLTGSNNTDWSNAKTLRKDDFTGNYIHYGVREFAMSAIQNGIALHGGFIPFSGTFLVFSDYARNAVRMSALMQQRSIFIYSHDSIGLGEDGPTHQPIEHISMLRMTPNLKVWRPADLAETAVAWQQALENQDGPSCLLLSRQGIKPVEHEPSKVATIKRGAYIAYGNNQAPDVILIATGSEVQIAIESAKQAANSEINVRVVSMPCAEVFLAQDSEYREYILPKSNRKRIAIEAGSPAYWYKFVGLDGYVHGIDNFGKSAPAKDLYQYFNLTVEHTVASIIKIAEKEYDSTCCN